MFTKFIEPQLLSPDDCPIQILDQDVAEGLVKAAADSAVQHFVRTKVLPNRDTNKMYLHINALGAGEYYGANRNGDYFPEGNLRAHYKTFEQGHVFRHHINKDPAKAMGKVLFATYNEAMHRVELVVEVDKTLGRDIEDRLSRGDYPWTSMACKTPFDTCSICKNQAHSRAEYCTHLTQQMGQVLEGGDKVAAINDGPLRFFDISIVVKPADVTSGVLEKVAQSALPSTNGDDPSFPENYSDASLKELTKQRLLAQYNSLPPELPFTRSDPPQNLLPVFRSLTLTKLANVLAETGIYPSVGYTMQILDARVSPELGSLGAAMVPWMSKAAEIPFFDGVKLEEAPSEIVQLVKQASFQSSFLPEWIEKSAYFPMAPPVILGYSQVNPGPPADTEIPEFPGQKQGATFFNWLLGLATASILFHGLTGVLAEKKAEFQKEAGFGSTMTSYVPTSVGVAAGLGGAYGAYKLHQASKEDPRIPQVIKKHPYLVSGAVGITAGKAAKILVSDSLHKFAGIRETVKRL